MTRPIFTLNEAADIVMMFDDVLDRYDITVPSPEDDERTEDNDARLYGSVFWELVEAVQEHVVDILQRQEEGAEIVLDTFEEEGDEDEEDILEDEDNDEDVEEDENEDE